MNTKMIHEQPWFLTSLITAFVAVSVSVALLAIAYLDAAGELAGYKRERAAVIDVERFIAHAYPRLDAATRRGHAEILVSASCGEIVYNAVACLDGTVANPPPDARLYARMTMEKRAP